MSGVIKTMNLLNEIKEAFSWRVKPTILSNSTQLSDDDLNDIQLMGQYDSHNLDSDFSEYHWNVFCLLSPQAFCYYLPAIYRFSIEDNTINLLPVSVVINMLDRTPNKNWWDDSFIETWTLLTISELEVTQQWLLFLCDLKLTSDDFLSIDRSFDTINLLIDNKKNSILNSLYFKKNNRF
jgi:hypothetical protein